MAAAKETASGEPYFVVYMKSDAISHRIAITLSQYADIKFEELTTSIYFGFMRVDKSNEEKGLVFSVLEVRERKTTILPNNCGGFSRITLMLLILNKHFLIDL